MADTQDKYITKNSSNPQQDITNKIYLMSESDSDDELLGITNNPIIIKTISHKKNQIQQSLGDQGWKLFQKNRSYRKNNKKNQSQDTSGAWNNILQGFDMTKIPTESPTMEMEQRPEKSNKYQRMREIKNITGFIVNVHDATNFDIDLEISPELHEKYRDVISNQYTYQSLEPNFLENPDFNQIKIKPEVGTTYRCRLKGVGINQLACSDHTYKSNMMCVEVKQLVDRTDGWVICNLSDIDVYQRLLVDIIINTINGPINLRDYLLNRMRSEENPIFYPYSSTKYILSRVPEKKRYT